ncbi:hypothetical protein [Cytophaga aurantiaca]|uniref:hypothetical protein n=1 Tax=Cytophaga aurantiaca TaxID=29530 RepID=UPI0003A203DC|nr:hypothetical protein [Cytophaga aurantiaca]
MKNLKVGAILFYSLLAIFLIMDLYPEYESPHFRYTGSDPNDEVLNMGWPFASFIIDFNTKPYVFDGPFLILMIPIQLFSLSIAWFIKRILSK